ncbi:MAG: hypothetical protein R2873_19235, partial [Caldilineaceae bacterium]
MITNSVKPLPLLPLALCLLTFAFIPPEDTMTNIQKYTDQNRKAWDEIAQQRHDNMFHPAAF